MTAAKTLTNVLAIYGLVIGVAASVSAGAADSQPPKRIEFRRALALPDVARYGRLTVHRDGIEALLASGRWAPPHPGDAVKLPDGQERVWQPVTADKDGWFTAPALRGGYGYVSVDSDAEQVLLLYAAGHNMVYVNGEPRVGDIYQTGKVWLPVMLHAGRNHFLFRCGRGRFRAELYSPEPHATMDLHDNTLPDLLAGEKADTWGAVVVINPMPTPLAGAAIRSTLPGANAVTTAVPQLLPLSVRKVGFRIKGQAPDRGGSCDLTLELLDGPAGRPIDRKTVALRVRKPEQTRKWTFISEIDGSVQYYAVNPAQPLAQNTGPLALVLSLHGANVEAIGQADAYSSKTWAHIVVPTNRRPFGFDWEDWGRLDALEVLDIARKRLQTDPQRMYLTGHSMGGHGAWQLGALFPDRFAAIGPSAGWISFASYGGAPQQQNGPAVQEILRRAAGTSNTLAFALNYLQEGIYILHGEKDDNVPVGQSRAMFKLLRPVHPDIEYHEQAGAGHWWDASDEPGVDCVDWAPMFDFFARHMIPPDEAVRRVRFVTSNPGVSAWCHWAGIEAQISQFKPSEVDIRWEPGLRRFTGKTKNVARLALGTEHIRPGEPISVELDGQSIADIPWSARPRLRLSRREGKWALAGGKPPTAAKGPERYGLFKESFRHRVLFVYGTQGTPQENAWAFAKARYDAEQFWYRGNSSVDVIADTAFKPSVEPARNVILYGNADTNAAWNVLLADSPVQVRSGLVRVGNRELAGSDLACLFVRPRPDSDRAMVGVVAGSGLSGMRATNQLGYFVSGTGYPDCLVLDSEFLSRGGAGIRAAGFFGLDWSVDNGEFAWQEPTAPSSPPETPR